MKLKYPLVLFLIIFFSCKNDTDSKSNKDDIKTVNINQKKEGNKLLDLAIKASGGDKFHNSKITFDIDDLHYTISRSNNTIDYTLLRTVDDVNYKGTFNNGLLQYFINNELQEHTSLSKKFLDAKLEGFINQISVPHLFKQNFVHVSKEDDVIIKNKTYHTLSVSFTRLNDTDPNDGFVLYINPENHKIDYFTERQLITGNVIRFMEALNSRNVNGLKFSDYYIFMTPRNSNFKLADVYDEYNKGTLELFDTISLKNINVKYFE